MRVIASTLRDSLYQPGDPRRDQHDDAVRGGQLIRESVDETGDYSIRVYAYTDPFIGTSRWAVVGDDPSEAETIDFDTQAEAETYYESDVRAMTTVSGWKFQTTDVN